MFRIFIPIYLLLLVYSLFAEEIAEANVIGFTYEALEQDTIDDFSGIFALTEQVLLEKPIEEWPAVLKTLSSKNIPVNTSPLSQFSTNSHALKQMARGKPWYDAMDDIIYKRVGQSEWVLHFGPVETIDEMKLSEFLATISGAILLIATIVIWTFTVRRRIKSLEKCTTRFGEGDLNTRVSEKSSVKLSNLNRHFNLMADRIQELIESNKHLSNAVAHELRSPLTRIQFELEYMKDTTLENDQLDAVNSIEDDLIILKLLVDEMLMYAKYERQSLSLNLQPTNVNTLIKQWYNKYKFNEQISHRFDSTGKGTRTLIEETSFVRALENLVINAEKYGNNQVLITCSSDKAYCYIAVEDDGEGVAPDDQHKLFEPFARADTSRTRATGGYGMGLAIVAKIIERHKGTVFIQDSSLGGAKFVIQLPLVK